ncbi:hypothetical protein M408DRAFT_154727 [Serendipita vermifera MAFF 305830]|uniref:Uncharacterized protein n=1 Tax=Serendipita vermifera MAFF 305830 TaxID=933852 RepID=A0A0C2XX70_SERVB|nr:hypothetical protein M408DRAFT_154727 [Serendipita vermifera MAFF 305830]
MDPLEAALSSSFTTANIPPTPTKSTPSASQEGPKETTGVKTHIPTRSVDLEAERIAAMDDSWKGAYEERLAEWKAENAVRREQSEKTRGEWEKRSGDATYSFANPTAGSSMASSFVDARDLVAGEGEGGHGVQALDQVLSPSAKKTPANRPSTASGSGEDNSQGWENVPSESFASSYPSINFPPQPDPSKSTGQSRPREGLEGPSSSTPYYRRGQGGDGKGGQSGAGLTLPPVAPPSVTLAIFDTTLSTRARALALVSSLAINLVLPFINGIMLGFGEIAAKSLFGWGGWRDVAGSLGLRGAGSRKNVRNMPRDLGTRKETPTILTMP